MLDADAAPIIGTFLLGKRRVLAVRYNGQKYVRLVGRAKQDLRHRHPRLWELIDKQPLDIDSNALCAHQNGMAACGGYWRGDGQQQVGIVGFGGNRREFEQVLALGMLVGELALNFREESTQGGNGSTGAASGARRDDETSIAGRAVPASTDASKARGPISSPRDAAALCATMASPWDVGAIVPLSWQAVAASRVQTSFQNPCDQADPSNRIQGSGQEHPRRGLPGDARRGPAGRTGSGRNSISCSSSTGRGSGLGRAAGRACCRERQHRRAGPPRARNFWGRGGRPEWPAGTGPGHVPAQGLAGGAHCACDGGMPRSCPGARAGWSDGAGLTALD